MTHQPKAYKKFVATAATATLVATAVAPVAASAASDFVDVNKNYEEAVNYLVEQGITEGMPGNKFGTDLNIKRGDAAVFIARALKLDTENAEDQNFSDLNNRVKGAVNAVVAEGIASGKGLGKFSPDDLITRQEMAKMLSNAYELTSDKDAPFTDVNKNWMKYVSNLYENGITLGKTEDTFLPNANLTRGEFALFMYRAETLDEKPSKPEPGKDGITSAKAINDTRIEVEFGQAISKDFIREAERNGKYFAVYTAGNNVQSNDTVQSVKINFDKDGKKATFDLNKKDGVESGKKYHVALLDGDNNKVADVVHTYGPVELKESASRPDFEVSATADKIFVDFGTKMKDSALKVTNYEVYDEGGKKLGNLEDFVVKATDKATNKDGKWVNLNEKDEVEFKLGTESKKHLSAGKTYKLKVSDKVKTDDNKTLSETERTIKIDTPSVDEASPEAKVARITGEKQVTLIFDQDLDKEVANINPAQLDLRTSTGKTVNVTKVNATVKDGAKNALVLDLTIDGEKAEDKKLDAGTTYNIDMPANIVKNGIFVNAMNKATSELKAEAQENTSIKSMSAEIVANAKNTGQADLLLTFDQVPVLDLELLKNIQLFEKRDEFKLKSPSLKDAKFYGGDAEGKTIIIEDIGSKFEGKKDFVVRGDKNYDIEIKKGFVTTDSFVTNNLKATNKEKLVASTSGISVAAPTLDEVRIESAEKLVLKFKEDIKGDVSPSDLEIQAYVANRSDIFETQKLTKVSGSGYYTVDISGDELTIEAKEGVKFPTSYKALDFTIDADSFTNADENNGNKEITKTTADEKDYIDNAAPEIVSVYVKANDQVEVTFTEDIKAEGSAEKLGSLFFTDGGEEATEGKKLTASGNKATITFKDAFVDGGTDLSIVELEYKAGSTYYVQDAASNKVESGTIKGFFSDRSSNLDKPGTGGGEGGNTEEPSTPEEGDTVKVSELADVQIKDALGSVQLVIPTASLSEELQKEDELTLNYNGKTYTMTKTKSGKNYQYTFANEKVNGEDVKAKATISK